MTYVITAILAILYCIWYWRHIVSDINLDAQIRKLEHSIERTSYKIALIEYLNSKGLEVELDFSEIDKIADEISGKNSKK